MSSPFLLFHIGGLIHDYITTQTELNALERENITEAANWVEGRQHSDILNATLILDVHKRMLNRVWKWAGKQRTSNKNLGVFMENIPNELANLLADVKYWIENKTHGWDEIGARFHHRLVSIHVFVNDDGRHCSHHDEHPPDLKRAGTLFVGYENPQRET